MKESRKSVKELELHLLLRLPLEQFVEFCYESLCVSAIAFPELASGVTIEGVLQLLGTGIGSCLAISFLFILVEMYLPHHWFKKGFLFGIMILAIYGTPILTNPGTELTGFQAMLTIILFSCVFITGGLLMAYCFCKVDRWVRSRHYEKVLYISFLVFFIPALVMLGEMTFALFEK
ncbi:hypothetical protein [Bacillus sp. 7884-1]|uniref:hypothetical protein n=1 Tax=Bacillus sp. 7884-1 TaxID=2021693 RepID=UPI000BA7541E|nr:hypothetical protein [Bacillus sp. 7884-1]PAE38023.1 hypothetical protein CHI06_19145 [Bacillus sp. 7884-1]